MLVSWSPGPGWKQSFIVAGLAGVFLGLCGPFGSYLNGTPALRLGYWVAALWAGTIIFGAAFFTARRLALTLRLPPLSLLIPATLLGALPLAGLCRIGATALWPDIIHHVGLVPWYGQTLLVASPFTLLHARVQSAKSAPVEVAPEVAHGLLAGLPAGDIVALQMEDHYVRVHTITGSRLILMPMHQAIAQLSDVPGLRTHRSWWVARGVVLEATRSGRNLRLRLENGIEVPVSRANVAALRAAGLPLAYGRHAPRSTGQVCSV